MISPGVADEFPMFSYASESSCRNTMIIDDELVRNCRNASAVRFRERLDDMDVMKWTNIPRQERGKVGSEGRMGSYQYLC